MHEWPRERPVGRSFLVKKESRKRDVGITRSDISSRHRGATSLGDAADVVRGGHDDKQHDA